MPKVSAVLSLYGEKNMERSLRSLLEQTLDDIEFILVDDCSPDSAYDIAMRVIAEEKYAHLRDNIKIVHHEKNKGVAAVRRSGWEASTGDYIYQFDSDDWMDHDMLKVLWENAVEGDYDMVECDYQESDGTQIFPHYEFTEEDKKYEGWIKAVGTTTLWNKIFRRSVYENDITWPCNPVWEDFTLLTQLYYYARKKYYIDQKLYYYYHNPEGTSLGSDPRKKIHGIKEQLSILEPFMRSKGLYKDYEFFFYKMKSEAMQLGWELPRKEFLQIYPKDRPKILFQRSINLKTRLGHLTKLLGVHGISKLFCIILIFV